MRDDELLYRSVASLSDLLRRREVSSVEVTTAALERIEALDAQLRAFITVLPDQALWEAREADRDIQAGRWRGPLHGVPIALKDLYFTRGVRTTAASRVFADFVPDEDAAVTERLRRAGAILLGKTNMMEVAFGPTNYYQLEYGVTRNPWRLDRFPGGSSTGSGIAVATGMAYMAMGSDTGGSIRNPASFCGVTGLKPTYGLVSCYGAFPSSWSLDHAGPLARTAEDCAITLQAMAGYDPRDPASVDRPVPDYRASLSTRIDGLRIGLPREHFFEDLQPAVEQAVEGAIETLRGLGATFLEVEIPGLVEDSHAAMTVVNAEGSAVHRPRLPQRAEEYVPDVRAKLLAGLEIKAVDYIAALRACRRLRQNLERVFERVDLLLTPTRDTVAPRMAEDGRVLEVYPYQAAGRPTRTIAFNAGGQPAISIPCGFDADGLPVGLQLAGRLFDDATVLRAAHAYQQATDWHLRRPPITARC